ncbi:VOC family protein [Planctomicrobium piriforme]|uniref:Uncharacterized conserved protein PhnB, glyoxalase superfamily n=1 Tax=Planctomicrobium piriforme TaxID=1576369 RepID=A0A1I3HSQ6_9PLAN|nr:VOC family protein [Planctomicrobium piriforme]SFI38755.1 Uncharacterized conserved protein PhnB, glyoxalase superfamily [Planctomicrobium piriforme]
MPRIRNLVPVLLVRDLDSSIRFYVDVLGFHKQWRQSTPDAGENCLLNHGTVDLLLSTGPHLGSTPQFTGTFYLSMFDVDEFYEQIRDRADVVWPLQTMPMGQREFGIRDPDGYVLAFAEIV